jgi:uncharacterized protein (TIGR03118 family)
MNISLKSKKVWIFGIGVLSALFLALIAPIATFAQSAAAVANDYTQTNLVSNVANVAPVQDPNLVNPWGLSDSTTSPWWAADKGSGLSTLYTGAGQIVSLVVTIPPSAEKTLGTPTGTVFNSTSNFVVSQNGVSDPALFLFDTQDGTISGWNPNVNGTNAILAVDRSKEGAVYKGLAIATDSTGATFLFATNFHAGFVEVFNGNFQLVNAFTDPQLLNQGFAPFGIQTIGTHLFVTFAKQDNDKDEAVAGAQQGFVDVFNLNGQLDQRLISGGVLNAPWGVALAPANFGAFGSDLLVSNVGDDVINAFNPNNGQFQGVLRNGNGAPLVIQGLHAIAFGNGANAGATNDLFFTAGPQAQKNGLFGFISSAD